MYSWFNIGKTEGQIRILIAIMLIVIGTHTSWPLIFVGLFILYTGIQHHCPLYFTFKINETKYKRDYFLSQLPKYNPEPVFIFNHNGQLEFANRAAESILPELTNINTIIAQSEFSIQEIIDKKLNLHSRYHRAGKTFVIALQGAREIKSIAAYAFDISEEIKANQEIISTQKEIVYTMGEIGEKRSNETGNHVRRVAEYSELLGLKYGLHQDQAKLLKMASPMHDIGKIAIPDAILNKPAKLNREEFEVMKTHAQLGYDMLNHSERPILKAAAIVAYQHHEKFNGQGYPQGLAGEQIHIYGRITAIADVFDALSSDRVYKKAWNDEQIYELFRKESGQHFDPKLIELFFTYLDEFLTIRQKYQDNQTQYG